MGWNGGDFFQGGHEFEEELSRSYLIWTLNLLKHNLESTFPEYGCTFHTQILLKCYRILPIIGASPNRGTPIDWETQYFPEGLK